MNKEDLKCFICKTTDDKKMKRVLLPDGKLGYVHNKHHGVDQLEEI